MLQPDVVNLFLFAFNKAWKEMLMPELLWCLVRTNCKLITKWL